MGGGTYTTIGTIGGAVVGTYFGNPWMGASIGASLGGGLDTRNTAHTNADIARSNAAFNANTIMLQGQYNSQAIMAAAALNAKAAMAGANLSAGIQTKVAGWNAEVQRRVAEYNASLLEDEAALVWEAAELDIFQFDKAADQVIGTATAAYGASGVRLDEPTDSPALALLDMETEKELEIQIMRHNADIQAGKLLDAAAHSRWEGEVAARTILYEGWMGSIGTLASAAIGSVGALAQGTMDSAMVRFNSQMEAERILYGGAVAGFGYDQKADQAIFNGIMGAANSAAMFYNPKVTPNAPASTGFARARTMGSGGSYGTYFDRGVKAGSRTNSGNYGTFFDKGSLLAS